MKHLRILVVCCHAGSKKSRSVASSLRHVSRGTDHSWALLSLKYMLVYGMKENVLLDWCLWFLVVVLWLILCLVLLLVFCGIFPLFLHLHSQHHVIHILASILVLVVVIPVVIFFFFLLFFSFVYYINFAEKRPPF